ncbi:MAG: pentapeptide repeat-containing protein [Planctomycetes bacterium]|nr:pentapeptide repeat-containing protein [Planctomycetota bacterium]
MIVTFYSFKGGVGRTHVLLETAAQLAARGRSVVVWDLDLEAPGLARSPAIEPIRGRIGRGTLEILLALQEKEFATAPAEIARELREAVVDLPLPAVVDAKKGGRLAILAAASQEAGAPDYATLYNQIDWNALFAPPDGPGPAFFFETAQLLQRECGYEFVLVDSRTGLTDLAGVCALQIPDHVVVVFSLNEQNLDALGRVDRAITSTMHRGLETRNLRVTRVANLLPDKPARLRAERLRRLQEAGLTPHAEIPLRSELLLTDEIRGLALDTKTRAAAEQDYGKIANELEAEAEALRRAEDAQIPVRSRGGRRRAGHEEDAASEHRPDADEDSLRRRGILERAKRFEEHVAELFRLLGYQATVDLQREGSQFDIRLEKSSGPLADHGLVECKDTDAPVSRDEVRKFADKVAEATKADQRQYRAFLVARTAFANNAHEVAHRHFVRLLTYDELLRSLVDFGPLLDAYVRGFQGTALERLYVEQEIVLQADLKPGAQPTARPLLQTVRDWIGRPGEPQLTLLGDFGCGKTSFCRRLASELAAAGREKGDGGRVPILVDLRRAGSSMANLENLLTDHFQQVTTQPVNVGALLHLNREGRLILLFDGFDEILAFSEPSKHLEILREILRAAEGRAKVLLTCRTNYFRDRPDEVKTLTPVPSLLSTAGATRLYAEIQDRPGFEIAYVREFSEDQIREYLRKALPTPEEAGSFWDRICRTHDLRDLAARPFLLEMIVLTLPKLLEAGPRREVKVADLYEAYCEKWLAHTDPRLKLTRENKVPIVEYLARVIWESPDGRAHHETLYERATEFLGGRTLSLYDRDRIDFEVRTALFLNRDAQGNYTFIHKSFLEFFIARTLRAGIKEGRPEALDLRRLTPEVALFLESWEEAQRIPAFACGILSRSAPPRVAANALLLLYWHVKSATMPLLGKGNEGSDESEDYHRLTEAFRKARPERLALPDVDLAGADLRGIELSGADLSGANLTGANLRLAGLKGSVLAKADLTSADLRHADIEEADLRGACLDHVDARDANLEDANLTGADLTFGRFARVDFTDATFADNAVSGAGFLGARLDPRPRCAAERLAGSSEGGHLELLYSCGHSASVESVAWHPRLSVVASASADRTVRIWDVVSGRLLRTLDGHCDWVRCVSWDPKGERLASASDDRTVRIWDAASGRLLRTLEGHSDWVLSVSWDPKGERLASASDDRTVRIWDAASGRLLRTLEDHFAGVHSVSWDPKGTLLASGSADHTVRIWDMASSRLVRSLESHSAGVCSVSWAPRGERLASASNDGTVRIWHPASGRLLRSLEVHSDGVRSVTWDPKGERLASTSGQPRVQIWEATSGRLLRTFEQHSFMISSVSWDPTGAHLASAEPPVRIWDATSGRLLRSIEDHFTGVHSLSWDPKGTLLASASLDPIVRIWDAASGRLLRSLQGHSFWVLSLGWDPTGQRIASASADNTVRIWDTASGRHLRTLEGHSSGVLSVHWDPSGERLASASHDHTVRIWRAASGRLLHSLEGHSDVIRSVSWDPSGKRLASASDNRIVQIRDAASGRLLRTLEGHSAGVLSVRWDSTGKRIASASQDRTVRIWNASSGRLIRTLAGHSEAVFSVRWDPRGERLASASADHTVRIWDPSAGTSLSTILLHGIGENAAWHPTSHALAVATPQGIEIVGVDGEHSRGGPVRLFPLPRRGALAATANGFVSGDDAALPYASWVDGWATYDASDLPERVSPERVSEALRHILGCGDFGAGPRRRAPARPRVARRRPSR